MRSPYTLHDPPPIDPPAAVVERTAWSLAADLWHDHQPDSLLGADCVACRLPWPCPTWEVADGILGDVCAARPGAPPPAGPPRGSSGRTSAAPGPLRPEAAREPVAAGRTGRHARSEARSAWAETPADRRRRSVSGAGAEPGTAGSAAPAVWHDAPVGWGDVPEAPAGGSGNGALGVRGALFHPPAARSAPTAVPDGSGRSRRRAEPDETRTDQLPVVPTGSARTNGHRPDVPVDRPVLGAPPAGPGVRRG